MSARERLLYSTIDLVRRHGVAGTGIAAILERGDVSRRTVYLNFPQGKSELVREAVQVAGAFIDTQLATCLQEATPQASLAAFVAEWKEVVSDSGYDAGCPIAAAGLSRSTEPGIADVAGRTFVRWQTAISDALRRHGLAESTSLALANTALAAVEGAVVMAVAQKSLRPLDDVQEQLDILVTHHLKALSSTAGRRRR